MYAHIVSNGSQDFITLVNLKCAESKANTCYPSEFTAREIACMTVSCLVKPSGPRIGFKNVSLEILSCVKQDICVMQNFR